MQCIRTLTPPHPAGALEQVTSDLLAYQHLWAYLKSLFDIILCGAWWLISRFNAFRPKGRRFELRSSRHVVTFGKSFTRSCLWRFGVKLWHSICAVSEALLSSRGLEEAL